MVKSSKVHFMWLFLVDDRKSVESMTIFYLDSIIHAWDKAKEKYIALTALKSTVFRTLVGSKSLRPHWNNGNKQKVLEIWNI